MTTEKQADKARCILERLDDKTRHAIKIRTYFSEGTRIEENVREGFNRSKAADGYNTIMDSLYFALIVTMACIFDPSESRKAENTASIPVLMDIISNAEVKAELLRRSIARKMPDRLDGRAELNEAARETLKFTGIQAAETRLKDISALIAEYNTLKGSHLVERIRTMRNQVYAHVAIESDNIKLAYGNAEDLLTKVIPFLSRLQLSVCDFHASYEEEISRWQKYAHIFWNAVFTGVTKEPTTP